MWHMKGKVLEKNGLKRWMEHRQGIHLCGIYEGKGSKNLKKAVLKNGQKFVKGFI